MGVYRIIWVCIALFSLLNPCGFSRSIVLFAHTGLLAIARHRPTENPLEPRQTCRSVGFFKTTQLHYKRDNNKSHHLFYGASSGSWLQPLFKIIAEDLESTSALIREYL